MILLDCFLAMSRMQKIISSNRFNTCGGSQLFFLALLIGGFPVSIDGTHSYALINCLQIAVPDAGSLFVLAILAQMSW